jgi:hypothetical protein
MEISPESSSSQDIYKILIGTVLPRIIWYYSKAFRDKRKKENRGN